MEDTHNHRQTEENLSIKRYAVESAWSKPFLPGNINVCPQPKEQADNITGNRLRRKTGAVSGDGA